MHLAKQMLLIGTVINGITVLEHDRQTSGRHYFLCECENGHRFTFRIKDLYERACPCRKCCFGSRSPGWKGCGELSGHVFSTYRRHAKDRGLDFDITVEYAWSLYEKQNGKCALTGLPLCFEERYKKLGERIASLDRIDSKKGYVEGNVQWIHKLINHIKSDIDNDQLIQIGNMIAKTNPIEDPYENFEYDKLMIKSIRGLKSGESHHRSKTYKFVHDDGTEIISKSLKKFVEDRGLSIDAMRNTIRFDIKHQGWKAYRLEENIDVA